MVARRSCSAMVIALKKSDYYNQNGPIVGVSEK